MTHHSMTASDVARQLGVGRARVHQLDGDLAPVRCACGTRLYDPTIVAAVEAKRAREREALSQARRERAYRMMGLAPDDREAKP